MGSSTCSPWWLLTPGAVCPVPGVLPLYESSSTGFTPTVALIVVIFSPTFVFIEWLRILFRPSLMPVYGRAVRDSKRVVREDATGKQQLQPDDGFIAKGMKGFLRVDLDSTRNKVVVPLSLFLMAYLILGMGPVLGLNSFMVAPVSLQTQIAMQSVAKPEGDISAGMLGFSGVNWTEDSSAYDCSHLGGADQRACMIVKVAGGFTVAYAAVVVLAGIVAVAWGGFIVWRARKVHKYLGIARPLSFPPRLYSVVSLASTALGGIMMQWGLSAKFALETGALLPHVDTFSTGSSWMIVVLIKIHCSILEFILWHLVESGWDPESEDAIASAVSSPTSDSLLGAGAPAASLSASPSAATSDDFEADHHHHALAVNHEIYVNNPNGAHPHSRALI